MSEKRIRNPNYTPEEKITLLNIVEKYKNIILDKKSNQTSWKEKESTWDRVATDFNSILPAGIHRSALQLKSYFQNLKKITRKDAANERLSISKTGSGDPDIKITDPTFDMTLALLNKKTVYGLENKFDSDTNIFVFEEENPVEEEYLELNVENLEENEEDVSIQDGDMENNHSLYNEPSTSSQPNWSKCKPSLLKSRKNKRLAPKTTSRRTPTFTEQKSNLADQYAVLAEEKIQYYKMMNEELRQKQKWNLEFHENKMKQDNEKHELKKKNLLLDIQLKEKQLNILEYRNLNFMPENIY